MSNTQVLKRTPKVKKGREARPPEPAIDLDDVIRRVSEELQQLFGEPEEGRHRRVFFDRENHEVIKVPLCDSGISANEEELDTQGPIFARTWLDASLSEKYGIPILRMEEVEIGTHYLRTDLPSWVDFIDCRQVGYTRDGRLVAYDWDHH